MLTTKQGLAMLGIGVLIAVVLFGTLWLTRPQLSVCIEHNTASSSRQVVDGKELTSLVEDKERKCS